MSHTTLKAGTRVHLSGDSDELWMRADYNVRVYSDATVLQDAKPQDKKVLLKVDYLDHQDNVTVSVRKSACKPIEKEYAIVPFTTMVRVCPFRRVSQHAAFCEAKMNDDNLDPDGLDCLCDMCPMGRDTTSSDFQDVDRADLSLLDKKHGYTTEDYFTISILNKYGKKLVEAVRAELMS